MSRKATVVFIVSDRLRIVASFQGGSDEEVAQKEKIETEQEAKRLAGFEGGDVGTRSL